ncbi:unknown [Corallococcus sp. CAG:1435]|nr:unknown [Corallococcus sp. CAG:1435]
MRRDGDGILPYGKFVAVADDVRRDVVFKLGVAFEKPRHRHHGLRRLTVDYFLFHVQRYLQRTLCHFRSCRKGFLRYHQAVHIACRDHRRDGLTAGALKRKACALHCARRSLPFVGKRHVFRIGQGKRYAVAVDGVCGQVDDCGGKIHLVACVHFHRSFGVGHTVGINLADGLRAVAVGKPAQEVEPDGAFQRFGRNGVAVVQRLRYLFAQIVAHEGVLLLHVYRRHVGAGGDVLIIALPTRELVADVLRSLRHSSAAPCGHLFRFEHLLRYAVDKGDGVFHGSGRLFFVCFEHGIERNVLRYRVRLHRDATFRK